MKQYKKMIALFLAAALIFVGCGKKESEENTSSENNSTDILYTVFDKTASAGNEVYEKEREAIQLTLESDVNATAADPNALSQNPDGSLTETGAAATQADTSTVETDVLGIAGQMYSHYGYLIAADTGEVLLSKGAQDMIYPASMTKVMTEIVLIENLPNLDEEIQLSSEIIDPLYEQEASMAGFVSGEIVTVRDLLYGVMLPSGAECCETLAIRVAGSSEAFVDMMNQKAAELGLANTHFVTDSGLHDDNHFTTCVDMAAIMQYALSNETFRAIVTSHDYTASVTEEHPEGLYMESTLFKYMETDVLANGGILEGGKTGYTDQAQQCLVSLANVNGREYILVTAYAVGNHYTEQFHILDAQTIFGSIT